MKIALYTHPLKDENLEKTQKTAEFIRNLGSSAYFGKEAFKSFDITEKRAAALTDTITLIPDESLGIVCDFMICIGGDGTILRAAKLSRLGDIPLVGVNSGRIGYLAELEESEAEKLSEIISGKSDMVTETRMMLEVSVNRNGKSVFSSLALNEAVISKGAASRMLDT